MSPQQAMTVSEMAERVDLSRDRFYDLVKAGVFPPPAYDLRTRRPLYPPQLQAICVAVRSSGMGFDRRPVLFNRRRGTSRDRSGSGTSAQRRPAAAESQMHRALGKKLRYLGVERLTSAALRQALTVSFPGSTAGVEEGVVLRKLLQYFGARGDSGHGEPDAA